MLNPDKRLVEKLVVVNLGKRIFNKINEKQRETTPGWWRVGALLGEGGKEIIMEKDSQCYR